MVLSLVDHAFEIEETENEVYESGEGWRCPGGVQGQGTMLFFNVGAPTRGIRASGLARVFVGDVRTEQALLAPLRGH